MFDVHRKEITWGGRQLVFETGKIARHAAGPVLVSYRVTARMSVPIRDLSEMTTRIARGEFDACVSSAESVGEVGLWELPKRVI